MRYTRGLTPEEAATHDRRLVDHRRLLGRRRRVARRRPPETQDGAARGDGRRRPRPCRPSRRPMWFVRAGEQPRLWSACDLVLEDGARPARRAGPATRPAPRLPRAPTARRRPGHLARRDPRAVPAARSGPGAGPCSCTPRARSRAGASATSPTSGTWPAGRPGMGAKVAMINPLHAPPPTPPPRPEPVLRDQPHLPQRPVPADRGHPRRRPPADLAAAGRARPGAERPAHPRPGRGLPAEDDRPAAAVRRSSMAGGGDCSTRSPRWRRREGCPAADRFATYCALAERSASTTGRWPAEYRHPAPRPCARFADEQRAAASGSTSGASGRSTASWPPPAPRGSA